MAQPARIQPAASPTAASQPAASPSHGHLPSAWLNRTWSLRPNPNPNPNPNPCDASPALGLVESDLVTARGSVCCRQQKRAPGRAPPGRAPLARRGARQRGAPPRRGGRGCVRISGRVRIPAMCLALAPVRQVRCRRGIRMPPADLSSSGAGQMTPDPSSIGWVFSSL